MSVWKIQLRQRRQHLYNSRAVRSSRREAIKNDAEKKGRGRETIRGKKKEREKEQGTCTTTDRKKRIISQRRFHAEARATFSRVSLIGWIVISSCLFLSFFSLCCCFCCFRCFCCFCCFRCWYRWAVGNERLRHQTDEDSFEETSNLTFTTTRVWIQSSATAATPFPLCFWHHGLSRGYSFLRSIWRSEILNLFFMLCGDTLPPAHSMTGWNLEIPNPNSRA